MVYGEDLLYNNGYSACDYINRIRRQPGWVNEYMSIQIPFEQLTAAQKLFLYVDTRQPILNEKAIFSDGTKFFRIPQEPTSDEETKIRIRTAKNNIDSVILCYNKKRIPMTPEMSDDIFDFYEGIIPPIKQQIDYYFEIHAGNLKCYYNKKVMLKAA